MLHPDASSELVDVAQGFFSIRVVGPVLVSLPLAILDQLRDHHDHSHLYYCRAIFRNYKKFNLLLDDHVPEVSEGRRLGRRAGKEPLSAARVEDLLNTNKNKNHNNKNYNNKQARNL